VSDSDDAEQPQLRGVRWPWVMRRARGERAFQEAATINTDSIALIYAASAIRFPIRTRLKAAVAISAHSWLRLTSR